MPRNPGFQHGPHYVGHCSNVRWRSDLIPNQNLKYRR